MSKAGFSGPARLQIVPLDHFIGYRLLHVLDQRQFNHLTAWLLLLAGLKLIWNGVF